MVFISEPIYVKASHKDTCQLAYSHDKNDFDVIFSALPENFVFVMRVDGGWWSAGFTPKSNDTIYMDQFYNSRLLDSVPYSTKIWTLGRSRGVANWQADAVNRILSCNITLIDSIRYVKAEGAKLERNTVDFYPLSGWKIELQEYNTYSKHYREVPKIIGHSNIAIGHGATLS